MKQTSLLLMVVLVAVVIVGKVSRQTGEVNELLMNNIEALAAGEDVWYDKYCYGSGNVDCPDGTKAAYVVSMCSIE